MSIRYNRWTNKEKDQNDEERCLLPQPWSPEKVVTADLAKHLIESQFPQLIPVTVEHIGNGFDFTVYRVNNKYVFRFPRRSIALELLNNEENVLPRIEGFLPVPIPRPFFKGKPSELFSWPFIGCIWLPGKTVSEKLLLDDARNELAEPIAQFLKALHQIPVSIAHRLKVPEDKLGRLNIKQRMPKLLSNLRRAADLKLLDDLERIFLLVQNFANDLPVKEDFVLVHGDMHFRNFLVDDHNQLSGVIDWGDVHIGHRAVDLSIVYSFLPPQSRERFYRIYGNINEDTRTLAKFRALYVSVTLLLYGHDLGDIEQVREAKTSINYILQD
jgi:aminoglycoside phosphotransferase (APT) family kinase protein